MKKLVLLILLFCAAAQAAAPTSGQTLFQVKNPGAGFAQYGVTPEEGKAYGIVSGLPAMIDVGGGFESFTIAGSTGTPQTITDGNTVTFAAAAGLVTTASATDTLTISFSAGTVSSLALADGALQKTQNLADLQNVITARNNLELGEFNSPLFASVTVKGGAYTALYDDEVISFSNSEISSQTNITPIQVASETNDIFVPAKDGYFPVVENAGGLVDLADEVIGLLPDGNISSAAAWNAKQAAITGAASTVTTSDLTVNRALVSDGSGKVAVSATTATEVGYLAGVSSALQTQINGKIGGSTGSADTAILVANGTGGSTAQASTAKVTDGDIVLEARGGPAQRNIRFGNSNGGGIRIFPSDTYGSHTAGIQFYNSGGDFPGAFYLDAGTGGAINLRAGGPTRLRVSADAVEVDSATPFRVYNTYSSSINFDAVEIIFVANVGYVRPKAGSGGGTAKPLEYHTTATEVRLMSGSGTPEGAVSAPVGSIYTRTNGGANTTLYIKESGSGNTGWIAK